MGESGSAPHHFRRAIRLYRSLVVLAHQGFRAIALSCRFGFPCQAMHLHCTRGYTLAPLPKSECGQAVWRLPTLAVPLDTTLKYKRITKLKEEFFGNSNNISSVPPKGETGLNLFCYLVGRQRRREVGHIDFERLPLQGGRAQKLSWELGETDRQTNRAADTKTERKH